MKKEVSLHMSPAKTAYVVRTILNACGVGRMLLVAEPPPELMSGLLLAGVDVCVLMTDRVLAGEMQERFPGRVLDQESANRGRFDDVVVLSDTLAAEEGVPRSVIPLLSRFERSLIVILCGEAAKFQARAEWERLFIYAGLRKHPMIEVVATYSTLDEPTDPMVLMFEPVPAAAAEAYPLKVLIEERDLHTDMTREPGRRSDAHMTRYAQAAQFVRAGDRILDLACGLGYGSHVLANATQAASFVGVDASEYAVQYATVNFAAVSAKPMSFRVGDAEDLAFLENDSVDFAVSVETLEHLHHPTALLAELMRVLTPGGRAYLSVPFDWSDETGEDPNPFHHHVYDWGVLERQVREAGFLLERAWTQDAGGGQKLHHAKRAIHEFDPRTGPTADGEWLLALVMKPLGEPRPELPDVADVPNILAFNRDYHNAALVRGLVSIGWRATSGALLSELADKTLAQARPEQADFGAALCVRSYLALTDGASHADKRTLAERAIGYASQVAANPTVLRWQVSLTFVAGLLFLSSGDRGAARIAFERAALFDVRPYSPLLGTKTVTAAFTVGQMSLADGSEDQAEFWWDRAVAEARTLVSDIDWREVIGPAGAQQTFGLPELAEMLLTAAKAMNGLVALRNRTAQPGALWRSVHSTLDCRAELARMESAELRDSFDVQRRYYEAREQAFGSEREELLRSKEWLDSQYHHLTDELAQITRLNQESKEWLEGQRDSLSVALARTTAAYDAARADHAAALSERDGLARTLESAAAENEVLRARIEYLKLHPLRRAWLRFKARRNEE